MTEQQLLAVRCALADLCGALQAHEGRDTWLHDWDAHLQTIEELATAFGLEAEVPEDCK
jgi:hypothetical protein